MQRHLQVSLPYTSFSPQKNPHMYNKRNEFKRLILFAVRPEANFKKRTQMITIMQVKALFFNTVSKTFQKKNRCSHVRQKPNSTLMMIMFKCQWKWVFDPHANLCILPDKGFARHTRWSKSTKQYNLGLFWNKKASF